MFVEGADIACKDCLSAIQTLTEIDLKRGAKSIFFFISSKTKKSTLLHQPYTHGYRKAVHRQIAAGFNLRLAFNRAEYTCATHVIP